jgi:hypothetical protein
MIEGFFFNGVHILRDQIPVGMGVKYTAPVLPDVADPELPITDPAPVTAEMTQDPVFFEFLVKKSLFQHGYLLLDCPDAFCVLPLRFLTAE